eukprot:3775427-Rhodomonas_salina.2
MFHMWVEFMVEHASWWEPGECEARNQMQIASFSVQFVAVTALISPRFCRCAASGAERAWRAGEQRTAWRRKLRRKAPSLQVRTS